MPHDLVRRLRIALQDVDADPHEEVGVQVPGFFWTDEELEEFLDSALAIWNLWPPETFDTFEDLDTEQRRLLLWKAVGIAESVLTVFAYSKDTSTYEMNPDDLFLWVAHKVDQTASRARLADRVWAGVEKAKEAV